MSTSTEIGTNDKKFPFFSLLAHNSGKFINFKRIGLLELRQAIFFTLNNKYRWRFHRQPACSILKMKSD